MKTKDGITVVPGGQLKKSYEEYDDAEELYEEEFNGEDIDDEEYYDDDEELDEEYYEECLAELQYLGRLYKIKSEKSLTYINDYIDRIKNNDYVILSPDLYVLEFLSNSLKDADKVYFSFNESIEKKQIVSDYKKIEPYKTTFIVNNLMRAHVYHDKNKKSSKKTNELIKKKMRVIAPFIDKFRDITDFNTSTAYDEYHIFMSDHKNVYKVFFGFKIFDGGINFYKNFMEPMFNLIRNINKKHNHLNFCIDSFKNDVFALYGYDEDVLQTYNVVISFTLDINEKCMFNPVQHSFEEKCVVFMDPDEDDVIDINNCSDFLPDENRFVMKAANVGLRNTKPVPSTGKKVVDFVFGEVKETEDDVIATVECIYDNGDNTTVEVSVYCSFTNLWVQMLRLTEGKCDDPKLYDKLLAWYRDEN